MATALTSTNPFLNIALPSLPSTNQSSTVAKAPVVPNMNFGSLAPTSTGGATTTPGAPAINFNTQAKPATATGYSLPIVPPTANSGSTSAFSPTVFPPAATTVSLHPNITTPSGAVVSPSTGGVVTPSPNTPTVPQLGGGGGKAPAGMEYGPTGQLQPITASTPGTPSVLGSSTSTPPATLITTPTTPDTSSTDPNSNPLFSNPEYQAALKAYQDSLGLSPDQTKTQQDINNLQDSLRQAFTNTAGQAIPLDFITGQQKQLQSSEANLEAPLESKAALLEAQRQANISGTKFALDTQAGQLAALRDYSKPVALGYGGSLASPATGAVVTPAFGGSGSGGATDVIGKALSDGRLTPDMVTRYGIPFITQALQNDPGYNFVTQKASVMSDTSSLTQQTQYLDTTTRAYNTATDNFGVITQFMSQYGINQSDVPIINQLQNKVKAGLTDPGAIAAFNTQLSGLRSEYAQVLSRGGDVTDSSRAAALQLIPDNLSPSQMATIKAQLDKEGGNAIKEAQGKVSDIKKRLGDTGAFGTSSTPSGTAGSIFDF